MIPEMHPESIIIRERSDEGQAAWEILRTSPTVRMLAVLAGPYWPQPTASQIEPRHDPVERREALLDDALDDSFPASDPPAITSPVYGGWRSDPKTAAASSTGPKTDPAD
jgi:hypothetical protein